MVDFFSTFGSFTSGASFLGCPCFSLPEENAFALGCRRQQAGKKVSRNDPCPCGSGKKYKHCCLRNRDESNIDLGASPQQPQYPIGTVAMYGPDDKTTTKMAAGVILHENAEPIMMRWVVGGHGRDDEAEGALGCHGRDAWVATLKCCKHGPHRGWRPIRSRKRFGANPVRHRFRLPRRHRGT